jgi:hypothetical protein
MTSATPETPDAAPGLRPSLEAILLVADEPVPLVVLAQVLERPRNEVEAELRDLAPRAVVLTCARSRAAGGSTPARIARRWSSVSSVTDRRSG